MRVTTQRLVLASWWLASGLEFVETSAVEDAMRHTFVFNDPEGREREVTAEFFSDDRIQRFVRARHAIASSCRDATRTPSLRCTSLLPGWATR